MLSIHPEQELDGIAAGLAGGGACALVLIEAGRLERIERRFGGEAYRRSMEGLKALVSELAQDAAPDEQIFVTEERSRGDIIAFVFAPRSHGEFYGTRLPELARTIARELLFRGRRAVYPYHKHALELPIMFWPEPPRRLLRISAQLYNRPEQYRALADALQRHLADT